MKIGILSDSHHRTLLHREAIYHLLEEGAEYLLHAGDIDSQEHIEMLKESQKPYSIVFGNNDNHLKGLASNYPIYQEPHYIKIKNLKIKMMHMPYYMTPDADLVISGHTHYFAADMKNGTLFLNPGEVCAREKKLSECVLLTITDELWSVEYFFRHPDRELWQSKEYQFIKE